MTVPDQEECLKQQRSLHTLAPLFELPSYKSTLVGMDWKEWRGRRYLREILEIYHRFAWLQERHSCTACPRSSYSLYIVTNYNITWVTTFWTHSTNFLVVSTSNVIFSEIFSFHIFPLLTNHSLVFRIRDQSQSYFFHIFIQACATCSELPSSISTMELLWL